MPISEIAPDEASKAELLMALRMVSQFRDTFKSSMNGGIYALITDGKVANVCDEDGKKLFPDNDVEYPCAVCKGEVMEGNEATGQGLCCSKCAIWFHNQCMSTSLSTEPY